MNLKHSDGSTFDRIGCELVAGSLSGGNEVRIRVTGTSMLPSIWPGDTVTVRPIGDTPASAGRIIVFTREGRLFAHRIVAKLERADGMQLITRGDAHVDCDPPVVASEVLGTVASITRGGREVPISLTPGLKMLSFGIRHSDFVRRVVLKIHAIRNRWWTAAETQCSV